MLFFILRDKNYRKNGKINRLTKTMFFGVNTDQDIDETKKMLTESEKKREPYHRDLHFYVKCSIINKLKVSLELRNSSRCICCFNNSKD